MFTEKNADKIAAPRPALKSNTWLTRARQVHLYLGAFFGPSIIFFAFSGAFQLFGLHDSHSGSTYKPPVWIQKMDSVHQLQVLRLKVRGGQGGPGGQGGLGGPGGQNGPGGQGTQGGPGGPGGQNAQGAPGQMAGQGTGPNNTSDRPPQQSQQAQGPGGPPQDTVYTYILKWFFLGPAIGLILMTLLGVYMSFKFNRNRLAMLSMLILGASVPGILLILMRHH